MITQPIKKSLKPSLELARSFFHPLIGVFDVLEYRPSSLSLDGDAGNVSFFAIISILPTFSLPKDHLDDVGNIDNDLTAAFEIPKSSAKMIAT